VDPKEENGLASRNSSAYIRKIWSLKSVSPTMYVGKASASWASSSITAFCYIRLNTDNIVKWSDDNQSLSFSVCCRVVETTRRFAATAFYSFQPGIFQSTRCQRWRGAVHLEASADMATIIFMLPKHISSTHISAIVLRATGALGR